MNPEHVTVNLSGGRGPETLHKGTIARVRPHTSGHGSFIVCMGGTCYSVTESHDVISRQLA